MTVTQTHSNKVVIRSFTSAQWDGRSNPKPVNAFAPFRGKRLWAAIIAFVLLCFLGFFLRVVMVLAFIGLVIVLIRFARRPRPQHAFVSDLMADVNDVMSELTDNSNTGLSVKDLAALRDNEVEIPLPVNGVSGLNLGVVSDSRGGERIAAIARTDDRVGTTRIIVTATAPDYGTASFDRLLQATLNAE
ncbi:hypothetical protein [Arthrobacter sp. 754]|uniref:hypothetical protein n=1 Tax=Arthrobacter sp. 754 TaxID=3156315 RepID=UPI003398095F